MRTIFFITALLIAITSFSEGKIEVKFNLQLRDGNNITGTSDIKELSLETAYGKLEVPIKNLTSIELGLTEDKSIKSEVIKKIKLLNNSDLDSRMEAYKNLIEVGIKAIPTINNYVNSKDYNATEYTDYTAKIAFNELCSKHGVSREDLHEDIFGIDYKYKIGGKSSFSKIKLKTEYGELEIPREKIKQIDITYIDHSSGNHKHFTLMASTHISGNKDGGWLNTGIVVKPGQKINIMATGEITLASLSNGKYTPDGKVGSTSTYYTNSSYPTYGNLVYKISESGKAVKAGSNYNGVADSNGVLFISIYESVYKDTNSGSYSVNISVN